MNVRIVSLLIGDKMSIGLTLAYYGMFTAVFIFGMVVGMKLKKIKKAIDDEEKNEMQS